MKLIPIYLFVITLDFFYLSHFKILNHIFKFSIVWNQVGTHLFVQYE